MCGRIEKAEKIGIVRAFLAQSVERAAFNRKVVGSRPTGGVFYNKDRRVRKRERRKTAD